MRTFKTMILTAAVAGLLLMTATGAMAAYTGLYTSSGNPDVTLGANSFHIGANQYNVNQNNSLWSASGSGGYFYGASLDTAAVDQLVGSLPSWLTSEVNIPSNPFGFIRSSYAFDQTTTDDINNSISGFIGNSLLAIEFFQASPGLAEFLLGGTLQEVLTRYAQGLLDELDDYNLAGAGVGYGFFYENGDKFDVTMGSLDQAGLVAMFDGTGTNTYTKATPIPGAIWLLGSGLVGLAGLRRRMRG